MFTKIGEYNIYKDLHQNMHMLKGYSQYMEKEFIVRISKEGYKSIREYILTDKLENYKKPLVKNIDSDGIFKQHLRIDISDDITIMIENLQISSLSEVEEPGEIIIDILRSAFAEDIAGLY